MYQAASNVLQNQVLVPLSYLVSQSSAGARGGTRPLHKSSATKKLSQATDASRTASQARKSTSHTSNADGSSLSAAERPSPNILSIITPLETNSNIVTTKNKLQYDAVNNAGIGALLLVNHKAGNEATICNKSPSFSQDSKVQMLTDVVDNVLMSACADHVIGLYTKNSSSLLRKLPSRNLLSDIAAEVSSYLKSTSRAVSPWHVSHVSGNSFAANKEAAATTSTAPIAAYISGMLLSHQPSGFTTSVRGFKTLRTIEREASRHVSVRDRFLRRSAIAAQSSAAVTADAPAASGLKFKGLVLEQATDPEEHRRKLAFAEGYMAADSAEKKKQPSKFMQGLRNFNHMLSFIVLIGLVVMSTMGNTGGILSRLRVPNGNQVMPEDITVTFDDVRGVEEAKEELEEIVEFLKSPEKFTALGAELPKGVLLVGPPGTGKTLLARAVAGEAGVPFFHAAGPEFDEILVGQGARRVRDLFRAAKSQAPCVIFIDEIDSVGAKRSNSMLHPYANQTINQLLAEMDGFHKNEGVIVLGATNRRDDLDKALLRPGRFDVEVQVPIPDLAGRREIFQYYLGKIKIGPDVVVEVLGRGTTGFTGADIKNVVNQAALRAAADLVEAVSMKYLEYARDKVLMGPEKKTRIPDEDVNKVTAYHEGGHTLVAHYTPHSHPLHKVTIIPRGASLGHTAYIPAKEQYNVTRAQMLATLDSLMGGRAAEELIFGADMITSGAASDLKQATSVATMMVKDLGMSERLGLRTFEENPGQLLGGGDTLSVSTREVIDSEIKKLLEDSYERARNILRTHAKEHKALAEALLKYETLDADDVKAILDGRTVSKDA